LPEEGEQAGEAEYFSGHSHVFYLHPGILLGEDAHAFWYMEPVLSLATPLYNRIPSLDDLRLDDYEGGIDDCPKDKLRQELAETIGEIA